MTSITSSGEQPSPVQPLPTRPAETPRRRFVSWIPSWGLVATKHLEMRKRRGLMATVAVLIVGVPALILGVNEVLHVVNAKIGPPGPTAFLLLCSLVAEFGFIAAAALGAAAATTDLSEGVFRHLVATGRSRLALYLARIPAGLSIVLPLVAVAFTMLCLVTVYGGVVQPASVDMYGAAIPAHLGETQLSGWLAAHPRQASLAFGPGLPHPYGETKAAAQYAQYAHAEASSIDPTPVEMVNVGLWLELEVAIGFTVGLGLGALSGQRTISTVLLIALEIIVTPIATNHVLPYLLDVQRLLVGVAMAQLRPAALAGTGSGGPLTLGASGGLGIPPMPTWAMIAVIVGWIGGWSVLGAWRMVRRDA
jgi:hypothetical protein